jgi:hypothetical protein
MNMTSRFTLVASAGLIWAGCSAPADGPIADKPTLPPPGIGGQASTAGTGGAPATTAGTGGVPAGGTGGGGGAPLTTAGTGGAPAGGAGGTGGGGGAIPTGTGLALTHAADGWVAGSTNQAGIQGSFYEFGDFQATPPGDTTAELGDLSTPATVCISGVASQVLTPAGATEPAYGQYYGGGLALNLADPGGGTGAGPWARGTVTGFTFTVTGPTIPTNIRFNATTGPGAAPSYCDDAITTTGAVTINLGALVTNCWEAGGTLLPATQTLEAIQWQVVTVTDESTPFDFCIENLAAVTAP